MMEALYDQQLDLQEKNWLAHKDSKAKGQAEMTKANAIVRERNLSFHYKTFCLNHNKIIANFGVDKGLDYFKLKIGDLVQESYMDNKAEFQEFLDSIADLGRSSIKTNATVARLCNQL
ncbi:hypothetical protein QAD02_020691 [Eretmocerus hayati]|uniref:Uncharacterized protein n=1 Tax=Eretmocerus hayati TaxID=131215 RepID=A0ACC2PPD1_9HYME|nr:hypothetical protein QAD02_020691 [Eretmocerus hayati]